VNLVPFIPVRHRKCWLVVCRCPHLASDSSSISVSVAYSRW